MSIKKRLILSNIAMIVVPIVAFLIVEMLLGPIFLYLSDGALEGKGLQLFLTLRLIAFLGILMLTNGLLTYVVSKSILNPVQQLTEAAKEISAGNLNFKIHVTGKDEIGQLAQTFETMRTKLQQAVAIQKQYENNRKQLIANISHDLKTPLTAIKGYVKGVLDGVANTPEKLDRYMKTIDQQANDMAELIDELFLYSKLDLAQVPFHFEKVDLRAYLLDFIDKVKLTFEQEGGSVSFHANEADCHIVFADREKLKRVLTNIMQNSMKYMDKADKKMSVRLMAEAGQVIVQIKDNGSGIPEEAMPHVFDSFYRTDLSRNSKTGGSGLGLAISKKIIEEHGGTIWAESELGKGTSIFFSLKKPQATGAVT